MEKVYQALTHQIYSYIGLINVYERFVIVLNQFNNENGYTGTEDEITFDNFNEEGQKVSVPDLIQILKDTGIKVKVGSTQLDKRVLMKRCELLRSYKLPTSYIVPKPFNENAVEFWLPLLTELMWSLFIIVGTILSSLVCYHYAEVLHSRNDCANIFTTNMYSLQCFVAKRARSYFENLNYNIVYTTMIGVGVATARIFGKAESSLKKLILGNE